MEILKKNAANLLKVKTIVTVLMTVVFCILAVTGAISSGDFLTVFMVVIAFYFGTQSEKKADKSSGAGSVAAMMVAAPENMQEYTGNEMEPEANMDTLQPPDDMAPIGF